MGKNKMPEVAAIFGKKMGEEFVVKTPYGELKCKFINKGVTFFISDGNEWSEFTSRDLLLELITGKAIVKD